MIQVLKREVIGSLPGTYVIRIRAVGQGSADDTSTVDIQPVMTTPFDFWAIEYDGFNHLSKWAE